MKSMIIVTLALLAIAAAIPADEPIKIVRANNEQQPDGGYFFSFESEDGIKRDEVGQVKEVLNEDNKPQKVVAVSGSYSYVKPDGEFETINFVADENGYRAEGPSIPKAPARR